jgi:hypothetical protein
LKRRFYIAGEWDESEGAYVYWNGPSRGWVPFEQATPYLLQDLANPLPEGASGYLEVVDDKPIEWFSKERFENR